MGRNRILRKEKRERITYGEDFYQGYGVGAWEKRVLGDSRRVRGEARRCSSVDARAGRNKG
jgi:hypothetical protein